jgi:beta-galactosidase/beta-glucuronidase
VDNSGQPNSRWYSGPGIYRHVRLVVVEPVHVEPDGVFVSTVVASAPAATLRVELAVRNELVARSRVDPLTGAQSRRSNVWLYLTVKVRSRSPTPPLEGSRFSL